MVHVVGRLLERRALLDGHREAVVCGERRLTFHEFDQLTGQMASLLRDHGIARGVRVAALLYNGIEFCALYHAVARLGAILCPVTLERERAFEQIRQRHQTRVNIHSRQRDDRWFSRRVTWPS